MGIVWGRPFLVGTLFFSIYIMSIDVFAASEIYPKVGFVSRVIDNFHIVEPGCLYRSAQLSLKKLHSYAKKFEIKTIINLRGKHKNDLWWRIEKQCAKSLGINLFNIQMSAVRPSTKSEIAQLLALYDHAQRPILIHCRGGADRTGEAAALWILDKQKKSKYFACKHLSWKYRHFRSLCPFKIQFICAWQGREWLIKNYSPEALFSKR